MIPHFDLPLRLVVNTLSVAEQDTVTDVVNCVEAVARHRPGDREMLPEFGVFDRLTFGRQPLDLQEFMDAVLEWEPRALVALEAHPDAFDPLIARLSALVAIEEDPSG